MGFFINANKFSLHATYRNRLIRAYLAASRTTRKPNLFTGFDRDDNIALARVVAQKDRFMYSMARLISSGASSWRGRSVRLNPLR